MVKSLKVWSWLLWVGALILIATVSVTAAPQETVAQGSADSENTLQVRITARKLGNGSVEFALQLRQPDNSWSDRILPRSRFFPSDATTSRWLVSSSLTLQNFTRIAPGGHLSGTTVPTTTSAAPTTTSPTSELDAIIDAEAEMALLVNELRSELSLAPLTYDSNLAAVARRWSQTMRDMDDLVHNPLYSEQYPEGWLIVGENIVWTSFSGSLLKDISRAFESLARSPGHYANMSRPSFNRLGVGVALAPNGMWVTQNFARYP